MFFFTLLFQSMGKFHGKFHGKFPWLRAAKNQAHWMDRNKGRRFSAAWRLRTPTNSKKMKHCNAKTKVQRYLLFDGRKITWLPVGEKKTIFWIECCSHTKKYKSTILLRHVMIWRDENCTTSNHSQTCWLVWLFKCLFIRYVMVCSYSDFIESWFITLYKSLKHRLWLSSLRSSTFQPRCKWPK